MEFLPNLQNALQQLVGLDSAGCSLEMFATQGGWANIVRYLVENTDVDLEAVDSGGVKSKSKTVERTEPGS